MTLINSIITAFSVYSRIPMPNAEWNEKNSRYAMCFFPLVGAAAGALVWLSAYFCVLLCFNDIFRAAVITGIPVFLTGGIHMDGYCDTVDALSSFKPREKKLEILKDPNAGAFAVIYACVWFLLYFSSVSQISDNITLLSLGFVLSRAWSALAIVNFKPARRTGMGADMQKNSQKGLITAVMCIYIATVSAAMIILNPICGPVCITASAMTFIYYRYKSYREFGGFTGDLAGWFLQLCELAVALTLAVSERIVTKWF